jgi:hypothetical protein
MAVEVKNVAERMYRPFSRLINPLVDILQKFLTQLDQEFDVTGTASWEYV